MAHYPGRVSKTQRDNEYVCFAVGIGSAFKDIDSGQEIDFHNNSMNLPCLSGTRSQHYLSRLGDYAVSAKGI